MLDRPHSPVHRLESAGAYMVTAATYKKLPIFRSRRRLTVLCETLLRLAMAHAWRLQAWAVFPNHYRFIAISSETGITLSTFVAHLHRVTALEVNREGGSPGRRVWFQYWDSRLTYAKSYLAKLNYVHNNAVHHGLVNRPEQYWWCSAGWFEREAERPFYETVMKIRSDRIKVLDDFDVDPADTR